MLLTKVLKKLDFYGALSSVWEYGDRHPKWTSHLETAIARGDDALAAKALRKLDFYGALSQVWRNPRWGKLLSDALEGKQASLAQRVARRALNHKKPL